MNHATEWRLRQARRIAAAISAHTGAAAAAVTGSTARGRADRFSDLDVVTASVQVAPRPGRFPSVPRPGTEAGGSKWNR